jgi:hypothetical protein
MEARFIYRNRSDVQFCDASTREMRGRPDIREANAVIARQEEPTFRR